MPETIPASGVVHWLGTGLSTGSGLSVLAQRAERTVLWGRTADKAARCADRLGLTGRVAVQALEPDSLAAAVGAGDIVISMLPAAEHTALARLSIARNAHFACTSYTSAELAACAAEAAAAGLVMVTEAGLDPGIDHALAHLLVARARERVGGGPATAWFTSYCGGVPAVANDFRYRFSWAPQGVLSALRSPARYREAGELRTAKWPWEATGPSLLEGEQFEVYPNRDSLLFLEQYQFPEAWNADTFVRGTLRLDGWRNAWADVFEVVRSGDQEQISLLAKDLLARYPMTSADLDRVVLSVQLSVQGTSGAAWSGRYLLDLTGNAAESAMAKTVSLSLAFAVTTVLEGRLTAGLHRGMDDVAQAERCVSFLSRHGARCALQTPAPEEGKNHA
jgi:saccharopine dehydrogenase (NADP+, L-glutamate forming)